MEIRQLNPNDAEVYLSIRLEALKDRPDAFGSTYEEEKNRTADTYKTRFEASVDSFTFGAFEGERLVGVVSLFREQIVKLRHRTTIAAMYIKPEKRGEGLGRALLTKAIEKAKELEGVEQIYLTVVTTNDSAKKLYASCGFEVYGKEKRALKYNNIYYDEELMALFL